MTDVSELLELEELDTNPRIDTVKTLSYDGESHQVHHTRVSAKFKTEDQVQLEAIVIRHFVDQETPHYKWGIEVEPDKLDELITGLEILRRRHM